MSLIIKILNDCLDWSFEYYIFCYFYQFMWNQFVFVFSSIWVKLYFLNWCFYSLESFLKGFSGQMHYNILYDVYVLWVGPVEHSSLFWLD